ncbi:group II intron reverse transcriptase/maturase [Paenibacillus alginolyticus]|uniref:group II intron reverse transcriptase/maturase n=1 Tax=Paenibacillus alginolyticus TaxID=59839 RepID=UPI00040CEF63|nr:group II intron reverse transcriptase/maturase [Paenibacillus alginolyticus]MCY9665836.1 group II intron reverse transcriptase/maturase [Paenibacillus alginolyticus]
MNACKTMSAIPPLMDWDSVNWQKLEKYVRKLQQRIYHAERLGKKRKVRDLQRLLLRSKAALLLAIKRVTQINKGKRTAGVDGMKVLKAEQRVVLYNSMTRLSIKLHKPKPALRTYIKKKNGKLRPLGIPTIIDRVYQSLTLMSLEPQWEYHFEGTSYGFRPKRSTHDALTAIYMKLKGKTYRSWIFEGDFKGCFDNLNHEFILNQVSRFPATDIIKKWLQAGYVDNEVFHTTEAGTPQGGIISPLLANIALHGMEDAIGVRYETKPSLVSKGSLSLKKDSPGVIRYADDFIIICHSREEAESMYGKLEPYLRDRGLQLSQEKTKITYIQDGFDFLGFNFRRYQRKRGPVFLVTPSKESVKKAYAKVKDVFLRNTGKNVYRLIGELNPIIRGYANYWRVAVAKETMGDLDDYIFRLTVNFLKRLHPLKTWGWISKQYFKPDRTGVSKDQWILTDPISGSQITKAKWTPIKRHVQITGNHSPHDKYLKGYFQLRDIKKFEMNNVQSRQKLAKKQRFLCPICKCSLTDTDEGLELHHKTPVNRGGTNEYQNLMLVHISCHISHHKTKIARHY